MLDIIIVFIVISMVVVNILKHVGSPGEWSKPDVSGGPAIPKNPSKIPAQPGNERDIYRSSSSHQVKVLSLERGEARRLSDESPVTYINMYQAQGSSFDSSFSDTLEGMSQEGLGEVTYNKDDTDNKTRAISLEIISSDVKSHTLSFSRHAIINGIIMSELLQPPKALRGKRNN